MAYTITGCDDGYSVAGYSSGYSVTENDLSAYTNNGEVVPIIVGEEITIYGDEVASVPIANDLSVDYICSVGSQSGNNYVINATEAAEVYLYISATNDSVVIRKTRTALVIKEKVNEDNSEISTPAFYDWASKSPSPYDWINAGTNIFTESGGYLTIAYDSASSGGRYFLLAANGLKTDLTVGFDYVVKAMLKCTGTVLSRIYDGSAAVDAQYLTTSYVEYTYHFNAKTINTCYLTFALMGAGEDVSIGYVKVYSPAKTITIIGNSLVAGGGNYELEKVRSIFDLTEWSGIGLIGSAPDLREGYSGKTYNWLVNDAESPFTKDGVLNIPAYYDDNSFSVPDFIYMRMGVNGAAGGYLSTGFTTDEQAEWIGWIGELMDAFLLHNTNVKIIISIPTNSENSGAGWYASYGDTRDQDEYIRIIHVMWSLIIANYTDYNDRLTVAYSPWGLDRDDGYPKTEGVHTNGVHPDAEGYVELGQGLAFALNNLL